MQDKDKMIEEMVAQIKEKDEMLETVEEDIKELLLEAPEGQLDASMKDLIKNWAIPIPSIQILEVIDKSVNASLASSFVIFALESIYNDALSRENISHEEVVKLATWRN